MRAPAPAAITTFATLVQSGPGVGVGVGAPGGRAKGRARVGVGALSTAVPTACVTDLPGPLTRALLTLPLLRGWLTGVLGATEFRAGLFW